MKQVPTHKSSIADGVSFERFCSKHNLQTGKEVSDMAHPQFRLGDGRVVASGRMAAEVDDVGSALYPLTGLPTC